MQLNCCGVREIHSLSRHRDAKEALAEFGKQVYARQDLDNSKFRYAVFTQANQYPSTAVSSQRRCYGENFAAYITANKLGTLTETEENVNPNSGNYVKVYVWTIDHAATRKLLGYPAEWVPTAAQTASMQSSLCADQSCPRCRPYRQAEAAEAAWARLQAFRQQIQQSTPIGVEAQAFINPTLTSGGGNGA